MLKFAIIGAGAGGQSMAAILTSKGYIAKLYDIDKEKIHRLQELKTIKVTGVIACEAAPAVITDRIDEVMDDVDVIMVVSTTDAHRSIAYACKPYLKDGQIVCFSAGNCASITLKKKRGDKKVIVGEMQGNIGSCRLVSPTKEIKGNPHTLLPPSYDWDSEYLRITGTPRKVSE